MRRAGHIFAFQDIGVAGSAIGATEHVCVAIGGIVVFANLEIVTPDFIEVGCEDEIFLAFAGVDGFQRIEEAADTFFSVHDVTD